MQASGAPHLENGPPRALTCWKKVPSLVDNTGYSYNFDRIHAFLARVKLEELEVEFRSQIEAVLIVNLTPTHLHWHAYDGAVGQRSWR
jgi:hypothetical protein